MAIIYYNEYIGDDDFGNPMYREGSYDDGSNETGGDDDGTIDVNAGSSGGADTGSDPDYNFWKLIGIDPTTTMENWKSPSNVEIESAIRGDPAWLTFAKKYGDKALSMLKNKDGKYDLAKIASIGVGVYNSMNQDKQGGYNVPIPKMDAISQQIQYDDPNRRPGAAGRQYITDTRYVKEGDTAGLAAAQAAVEAQKQGILAAYKPAAPEVNPYVGRMPTKWNKAAAPVNNGIATTPPPSSGINELPKVPVYTTEPAPAIPPSRNPEIPVVSEPTQPNIGSTVRPTFPRYVQEKAAGCIASLAEGGKPRYLQGETDGMADEIPSNIDGSQEAAPSHG